MAEHEPAPSIVDIIADAVVRRIEEQQHIEALAQAVVAYMEEQDRQARAGTGGPEQPGRGGPDLAATPGAAASTDAPTGPAPKTPRRRGSAGAGGDSKAEKAGKAPKSAKRKGT